MLPDQHLELDIHSVFSKCVLVLIKIEKSSTITKISSHQKYVHGYQTRISDLILSFSQLLFLNVRNLLLVFRFLFATCPCNGPIQTEKAKTGGIHHLFWSAEQLIMWIKILFRESIAQNQWLLTSLKEANRECQQAVHEHIVECSHFEGFFCRNSKCPHFRFSWGMHRLLTFT